MSTQTEHLKLDLREAADIFNPLSTNANFESLDNIIYEIQTTGGVPTYTTTASANLLKLSQNPTPNVTVFKFVAAGDANTWSYQETVNNIVALDGTQKTVKAGEMYVAWVNSANAMVVIAWPDVVNAQTFDGKAPAEWATKAQLDAVNQTAANATQTAQAAATVANNALEAAQAAKSTPTLQWTNPNPADTFATQTVNFSLEKLPKKVVIEWTSSGVASGYIDPIPLSIDFPDDYGGVVRFPVTTIDDLVSGANARTMWRRPISIQPGTTFIISFDDAYSRVCGETGSWNIANKAIVPFKIYTYD